MTSPSGPISSYRRLGARIAGLALLLALFAAHTAAAQGGDTTSVVMTEDTAHSDTPWLYLGIYGGIASVQYNAFLPPTVFNSTLQLPATATFTQGDGFGALAGFLAEIPLSDNFNVGLRAGYQLHSGQLQQRYTNRSDVQQNTGGPADASVLGTVTTKFGQISITPYARIAPFSFPFYFYAGPTILFPSQASFTYNEQIDGPAGVVYKTGRKTSRALGSKAFDKASTAFAVSGGAGYEWQLGPNIGLFLEAQIQPMLNDLLSPLKTGESWQMSQTALVLGFRYGLRDEGSAPPPPPKIVAANDTVRTVPKVIDSSFSAKGLTVGGLSDTITISNRKVKATEVEALLPYVFFPRDSAAIPERYIRLDAKNRKNFQVERLQRGNTLGNYYQILNIIGARMRDTRRGDLTITGCLSRDELGDSTLANRRAEVVRDYLVNVWKISTKRIKVVARGLPANPSLSEVDVAEGSRENQRVEFASEGYVFERPLELPDSTFLEPVGTVRFLPPVTKEDTSGAVDGWSLDVMIGDSLIKHAVTGSGSPPKQIDYQIENRPDLDLRGPVTVSSTLVIRDTLYQDLARIKSTKVVVRQEGDFQEDRTVVGGKYVDTYNLLLFSFDSSQATGFSGQSADIIRHKIFPNSTVRIIGHTDRIGLPYYNLALSKRRAEFAANLLNVQSKEVVGMGEKGLVYDNSNPEGRYYSRTVTVIVETPIPGESNDTSSQPRSR
ncbi:MAG: outer membrane protein class 4 [Chlorobi bacterium]|nr:outer membrane protein class 4 [Chlorobiota bacterium]